MRPMRPIAALAAASRTAAPLARVGSPAAPGLRDRPRDRPRAPWRGGGGIFPPPPPLAARAAASPGAVRGERSVWKPWASTQRANTIETLPSLDKYKPSAFWGGAWDADAPQHRPVSKDELSSMTRVGGSSLSLGCVEDLGLRLKEEACTEMQEHLLAMEIRGLVEAYGCVSTGEYTMEDKNGRPAAGSKPSSAVRVTGRAEGDAPVAPWGHGDSFDVDKVPEGIRFLLDGVAESADWAVGRPRDVSLHFRRDSFFKLDPHIDPKENGHVVFALSLLSDTVLTFVPPGDFTRQRPAEISLGSWTDQDVDVLLRRRSMLMFCGEARERWRHAIRTGVQVEVEKGKLEVCDWWGVTKNLVRRAPELMTIVISFERAKGGLGGVQNSLYDD